MAQNIYDQQDFYDGYSQLPRSVRGLDGAAEWPAIRGLLPELDGKRVVDLGCGFGWFCRWAATQGARSVVGLDLSENMLARARRDTDTPNVSYQLADLDTIVLPAGGFDFAYSSLAFHYIADFKRLMGVVHDALVAGSRFVFTIEHPIYMAPATPEWMVSERGHKTWPIDGYAEEGERRTDWLAKGVIKHHRTIGTTLNTLIDIGFVIDRVLEWSPAAEQIRQQPELAEERERPMILIVSVHRQQAVEYRHQRGASRGFGVLQLGSYSGTSSGSLGFGARRSHGSSAAAPRSPPLVRLAQTMTRSPATLADDGSSRGL